MKYCIWVIINWQPVPVQCVSEHKTRDISWIYIPFIGFVILWDAAVFETQHYSSSFSLVCQIWPCSLLLSYFTSKIKVSANLIMKCQSHSFCSSTGTIHLKVNYLHTRHFRLYEKGAISSTNLFKVTNHYCLDTFSSQSAIKKRKRVFILISL